MDYESQLQRLAEAGFRPKPLERYPGFLGVVKNGFAALLQPSPEGLRLFVPAGRLIGEEFAVLIVRGDRQLFKAKTQELDADAEMLAAFDEFRRELAQALGLAAPAVQ